MLNIILRSDDGFEDNYLRFGPAAVQLASEVLNPQGLVEFWVADVGAAVENGQVFTGA